MKLYRITKIRIYSNDLIVKIVLNRIIILNKNVGGTSLNTESVLYLVEI